MVIRQAYCFLNECALCGLSDFVPLHVLKVMPNQTTFLLALGIMNILQVDNQCVGNPEDFSFYNYETVSLDTHCGGHDVKGVPRQRCSATINSPYALSHCKLITAPYWPRRGVSCPRGDLSFAHGSRACRISRNTRPPAGLPLLSSCCSAPSASSSSWLASARQLHRRRHRPPERR